MYKRVLLIVLFLILPFVSGQTSREESIFIVEKVTQQQEVVIQREMQKVEQKLQQNMDENMKQLDNRVDGMLGGLTRKLIIGLFGGMTVVLIGYAWLVNYITRKYTPIFQRNLIRKKYEQAIKEGRLVMEEDELSKEEDKIVEQLGKEEEVSSTPFGLFNIFKNLKKEREQKRKKEEKPAFDYGLTKQFDYGLDENKSPDLSLEVPVWKKLLALIVILIITTVVVSLVMYLFFDFNLVGEVTRMIRVGG